MDRDKILDLYRNLTTQLNDLFIELGESRAAEANVRAEVFLASEASSPSGKDLDARYAAATHQADGYKLDGMIRSVEAQLKFLDRLLEHGDFS